VALPAVGDVIRYAYLWSHERRAGREDANKDRPAAVVAVIRRDDSRDEVAVFPITSAPPAMAGAGVEIPPRTRRRLGLQDEPCWIIVTEVNVFAWPGPDLRAADSSDSVIHGALPDRLMQQVRDAFATWRRRAAVPTIRRSG
jgi:hypothetical protein